MLRVQNTPLAGTGLLPFPDIEESGSKQPKIDSADANARRQQYNLAPTKTNTAFTQDPDFANPKQAITCSELC